MHSKAVSAADFRLASGRSAAQAHDPSFKFFSLSQLRKLRGCEQVAAVCYRIRSGGIEFLLVRTGSGHWTFPKGGVEPGLTNAQAAALEAFEEAGVHGRIEEAAFTRYIRRKHARRPSRREIATHAHLCEVTWLDKPREADRDPTWFSAEKAKQRLARDRAPGYAAELARVVDLAASRIQRSVSAARIIDQ